ncbi:carbohydrate kinase [Xanthomonas axonopodis pv. poinsettiicola]|uniref:carbohydrate kinase family protein n=1 Tax=Xanthomonas TaxID=338 RepID=UPI001E30AFD1|nr:carbohydrate kinase [Xanthomonas codiaei]MCC8535705.1 carbohydrate kinase [Xanthomonas codiaei]
MSTIRNQVICFGEALIDMLALPQAASDDARTFAQYAGGAPANVAVAVAKLGGAAHFVGMLGRDMFGDFLLQSLQQAGVATNGIVRTDQAKTALAFVALDAAGERSFSFYRPPAADLLFRAEHFAADGFAQAAVLHVCSNSMTEPEIAQCTLDGMRRAREAGAIVSLDLNLRPMLWPQDVDPAPVLWEALALADVVKLSREELDYLAGTLHADAGAVTQKLWQGQARWLLVTDGGGPVHWQTRTDTGQVPTFDVQVRDSTAAGDAFVGGLLYQLAARAIPLEQLCSDPTAMAEVIRFAAAVGALAVTRKGAFAAMPGIDDVHTLIQEQA